MILNMFYDALFLCFLTLNKNYCVSNKDFDPAIKGFLLSIKA